MANQPVNMMVPTAAQVDPELARHIVSDSNLFTFNNVNLRIIKDQNGDPWFEGKNVASALGYVSTANAIRFHVKKEHRKKLEDLLGNTGTASKGDKKAWWVSEAGC